MRCNPYHREPQHPPGPSRKDYEHLLLETRAGGQPGGHGYWVGVPRSWCGTDLGPDGATVLASLLAQLSRYANPDGQVHLSEAYARQSYGDRCEAILGHLERLGYLNIEYRGSYRYVSVDIDKVRDLAGGAQ